MKNRLEIIKYNDIFFPIKIDYDYLTITITTSYRVNTKNDIQKFIQIIEAQSWFGELRNAGFTRSITSMIHEWAAHNFLYEHNYETSRTRDVDIDQNESWLRKAGYFILSLFYR